jgi:hypothetical protein
VRCYGVHGGGKWCTRGREVGGWGGRDVGEKAGGGRKGEGGRMGGGRWDEGGREVGDGYPLVRDI